MDELAPPELPPVDDDGEPDGTDALDPPPPPLEGEGMLGEEGEPRPDAPPEEPPGEEEGGLGEEVDEEDWLAHPPMSIAEALLIATMFAARTAIRFTRC